MRFSRCRRGSVLGVVSDRGRCGPEGNAKLTQKISRMSMAEVTKPLPSGNHLMELIWSVCTDDTVWMRAPCCVVFTNGQRASLLRGTVELTSGSQMNNVLSAAVNNRLSSFDQAIAMTGC